MAEDSMPGLKDYYAELKQIARMLLRKKETKTGQK